MITDPRLLSIYVLGAAKGESVVLQRPNGLWGTVELTGGCAQSILLTCGTAWKPSEWPKGIEPGKFKSGLALYHKMKQPLDDEASRECGRWTLVFDDQGNCVGRTPHPPAIDMSEVIAAIGA
jgi:hypothetical protein